MQQSLLPIRIQSEVSAQEAGYDGNDLKVLAQCDDGNTYAIKRTIDYNHHVPIAEWVGHAICRQVGIRTPDYAALISKDGQPPCFGSRIASYQQIEHNPKSSRILEFFSGHQASLSAIYLIDAIITNVDRHGRNLFMRTDVAGVTTLVAFDFSRSWIVGGLPFGNQENMRGSRTQQWWSIFKRMGCKVDEQSLSLMEAVSADWLSNVLQSAPPEWISEQDAQAAVEYWTIRSKNRIDWAKRWLT